VNVVVPALAAISIFCSLITILAITIPLFDKEERKKMSTYNLYLVFLAIPDLTMTIIPATRKECFEEKAAERIIYGSGFFASFLVNVVIMYEIMRLLLDSKKSRRSAPPSFLKASMQVLVIYVFSILSMLSRLINVSFFIPHFTIMGCTFLYFLWVLFRIFRGRLLCYNGETVGRLNVLVIYFIRIVTLNMINAIIFVFTVLPPKFPDKYFNTWVVFQIWISFGLSLTKPDVLEYVRRLFSYIVRPCAGIRTALGKNTDPAPTELELIDSEHNHPDDRDYDDTKEDGSAQIKNGDESVDEEETTT
jgi:hypothetical protein